MNQPPDLWEDQYLALVPEHFLAGEMAVMQELLEEAPERLLARLMITAGELRGPETPEGLGADAWEGSYRLLLRLTPHRARVFLALIRADPVRFAGAIAEFIANSQE